MELEASAPATAAAALNGLSAPLPPPPPGPSAPAAAPLPKPPTAAEAAAVKRRMRGPLTYVAVLFDAVNRNESPKVHEALVLNAKDRNDLNAQLSLYDFRDLRVIRGTEMKVATQVRKTVRFV